MPHSAVRSITIAKTGKAFDLTKVGTDKIAVPGGPQGTVSAHGPMTVEFINPPDFPDKTAEPGWFLVGFKPRNEAHLGNLISVQFGWIEIIVSDKGKETRIKPPEIAGSGSLITTKAGDVEATLADND
jgi:hypothetical protein